VEVPVITFPLDGLGPAGPEEAFHLPQ
jgi:hypothetical protein